MSGIKISGLDDLQKKLKEMAKRAKELDGTHQVPLKDLLTGEFMRKHSRFSSFRRFLDASPFKVETSEDFDAIPDAEMDAYVSSETDFDSWEDMLSDATQEYVSRKMGF